MERAEIPIHAGFEDWKLIDYLALLWPERSRRGIADLFAAGRVRSGGRPVGARRTVGELGDLTLEGDLAEVGSIFLGEEGAEVTVLHEDSRLVAVSKPSGMPVVPDRDKAASSILGCLIRREIRGRTAARPADFVRFRIVHRIDRLTSGLVIVAKTPEVERALGSSFEKREVRKEYLALLSGVVRPALITVHCPVVPGRKGKMRAELGPGKDLSRAPGRALTDFEVLERFEDFTLVKARPLTGRTHQIRVHAWATGYPLAVDPLYAPRRADAPATPPMERLSLHASRLELPATWEEPRTFECPLPPDFEEALGRLRAGG
ncbi:MAG TPA: RluA family pseudouridine synthase [Planctomycetota bacterium]|nr:RluA family pseudouridine synthase [Planctomycetota bacterium]